MFHQAQHVHGMRLPQILLNKGVGEWEEVQDLKKNTLMINMAVLKTEYNI